MVGAHALGHGVVEQLDRRHRMLPCARHVADEVEEHREQPVAARHEVAVPVLRRPLVDLPDELAARGVLALAAEHVGLDQLGAPQRALITQRTGASLQRRCGRVRSVGVGEGHHLEEVQLSAEALPASPDGGGRGCCVQGLRSVGIRRSGDDRRRGAAAPPACGAMPGTICASRRPSGRLMLCHDKVVRSDILQQVVISS